jgi:hypothetical protein
MRTDGHAEVIVAFHNSVKAPKKVLIFFMDVGIFAARFGVSFQICLQEG